MKRIAFILCLLWSICAEAAITVRYFSTSAAGAGDGTTWADRAALFSAGNWSTVISGFDFTSNALLCLIGPGNYTCSQSLTTSVTGTPDPGIGNMLFLHGCDGSGNMLEPSNPDWTSDQAVDWDSSLPVIATTTNIATLNISNCSARLIAFTASGRTGGGVLASVNTLSWCTVTNSAANASAATISGVGWAFNSFLTCTGSAYSAVCAPGNINMMDNVRIVGVTGSSGNRDGVTFTGTTNRTTFNRLTIVSNGGRGFAYTGSNVAVTVQLSNSVIANNGGDGVQFPNTASQTNFSVIQKCVITGNGGYGINPGGANTNLDVQQCRLRDNASNNFNTFGNYPTDWYNYTTDSDDSSEYNNSGSGDFRIKSSLAWSDRSIGVSQMAAAGGASVPPFSPGGVFAP